MEGHLGPRWKDILVRGRIGYTVGSQNLGGSFLKSSTLSVWFTLTGTIEIDRFSINFYGSHQFLLRIRLADLSFSLLYLTSKLWYNMLLATNELWYSMRRAVSDNSISHGAP